MNHERVPANIIAHDLWFVKYMFVPSGTGYLLVVYFGLSSFMSIPTVKVVIWALGAVVLLYLGCQSIREAVRGIDLEKSTVSTSRSPLLAGYLVNISNSVAVVWWVGMFGSLLGASAGSAARIEVLFSSSAILIGILLWHSTMSLLAHWGKRYLNETTAKYVSVIAGVALVLFGMRFARSAVSALFR